MCKWTCAVQIHVAQWSTVHKLPLSRHEGGARERGREGRQQGHNCGGINSTWLQKPPSLAALDLLAGFGFSFLFFSDFFYASALNSWLPAALTWHILKPALSKCLHVGRLPKWQEPVTLLTQSPERRSPLLSLKLWNVTTLAEITPHLCTLMGSETPQFSCWILFHAGNPSLRTQNWITHNS